jgi:hypothetical protein
MAPAGKLTDSRDGRRPDFLDGTRGGPRRLFLCPVNVDGLACTAAGDLQFLEHPPVLLAG